MPKPTSDKTPWYQSWFFKSTLLLVLVAVFLGSVIAGGRWGLEYLRGRDRYDVALEEITCEPPVGMDRRTFLAEVRARAELPDKLHLLDEDLEAKLREAFVKHPWVEKVEAVMIRPPREIEVKLKHRTPVLAVKVGSKVYPVDGHGVLLPDNAPTLGLPSYDGVAPPPKGAPGTRWGNANVEAAARQRKR